MKPKTVTLQRSAISNPKLDVTEEALSPLPWRERVRGSALSPLPWGERARVRGLIRHGSSLAKVLFASLLLLLVMLSPAKADSADGRQTVVFFGTKDLLVIELELKVGEKPFAEAWRAGLAEIMRESDKNGDGFLSREETDGPKPPEQPAKENQPAIAEKKPKKRKMPLTSALLQTPNLWDADAEPQDGQLSLDELAWFLSHQGQGPFQTESSQESGAIQSPQVTVVNNAGNTLWGWLDQNNDSQLSSDELRQARRWLQKHDLDGDETISVGELEGAQNPFFSNRQSNQSTETPFYAVQREQSTTPLIRKLMQRSGEAEERENNEAALPQGVKVETLAIPKTESSRFDRDGNGLLDELELRAYLKSPVPMVRITVGLPAGGKGEPEISGLVLAEKAPFVVKTSGVGAVSILAGEHQIEIDASGLRPDMLEQALDERFRQIDRDNNGYLEQNEANLDTYFRNQFQAFDVDGDEKLYAEEWKPTVANLLKLAATQTRMVVQDAGQDVFTVLDSDRNMRISPREWLNAADRMAVWDKDGKGTLEQSEVPHVFRMSFGPGLPELPGFTPLEDNGQTPSVPKLVQGPKWFRAMDKNSDGDVSAKEFLGRPELFRQVDEDKNTLIDPREAARFAE